MDNETPSGVHLWLLVWKAGRSLEAHAQGSVRKLGMGMSEFGVLEALLHKGPLTVGALGQKVLLTSGAMTGVVDRLEKRGLVERTYNDADRRACIVRLTGAGTDAIGKAFAEHASDMQRAVACLDESEARVLAALLRKLGRGADALAQKEKTT